MTGHFGFIIALLTGFFGASFFMLVELQKTIDDSHLVSIQTLWTWPIIWLRCSVGIGGACILFFFFETDLLGGTIWPDLNQINITSNKPEATKNDDSGLTITSKITTIYVPNKNLSLLVVWSFLAGYSQSLVPRILDNTQKRYVADKPK